MMGSAEDGWGSSHASQGLAGICSFLHAGCFLRLEARYRQHFWTVTGQGSNRVIYFCVFFSVMSKPSLEALQETSLHTSLPRLGSHTFLPLSLGCGVEVLRTKWLIISENRCFWVHMTAEAPNGLLVRTKEGNEREYISKKLMCYTVILTDRILISVSTKHI